MKKEYPPRDVREKVLSRTTKWLRVCECGHFATKHDGTIFIGKCGMCHCPKFKYDEEQTIEQMRKWT